MPEFLPDHRPQRSILVQLLADGTSRLLTADAGYAGVSDGAREADDRLGPQREGLPMPGPCKLVPMQQCSLLGAKGIATGSKGLTTRNKKLVETISK